MTKAMHKETFNPDRPFNGLPLLPPDFDFDDIQILKAVGRANNALARLNKAARLLPNPLLLLAPLSMREAVASSGIENINTTTAEAFRAEVLPQKEIGKAQKETLYYKEALMAGFALLQKQGFLHTNSFIKIQAVLEPTRQGLRKLPGTVIINTLTHQIVYTPPSGLRVIQGKLKNYDLYFNESETEPDPLIHMAVLHYQFEAIHPFYDGNGRTGRILMVLYFVLHGILDLPILFISGYLLQNRQEYYRLLNKVSAHESWKEWTLFILNAVAIQAKETADIVKQIKTLMEKTEKSIAEKAPAIHSGQLMDYLFANPFYTQTSMVKRMKVHRNSAAKYLNLLVEIGLLEKAKYKRNMIYYHPQFLDIVG